MVPSALSRVDRWIAPSATMHDALGLRGSTKALGVVAPDARLCDGRTVHYGRAVRTQISRKCTTRTGILHIHTGHTVRLYMIVQCCAECHITPPLLRKQSHLRLVRGALFTHSHSRNDHDPQAISTAKEDPSALCVIASNTHWPHGHHHPHATATAETARNCHTHSRPAHTQ